jgi:hypothetical protein
LTSLDIAAPRAGIPAQRLADNFLHFVLYICILSSFFVFVQPAPYEYIAVVLGGAAILARVRFNRALLPVLILLLARDAFGALSLLQLTDNGWMRTAGSPEVLLEDYGWDDSARFLATSFYLGLTGVLFACIFAQDTMRRLATLRSAYVMAAVVATILGLLGWFSLTFNFLPGFEVFSLNDRPVAGFKDPDLFGCWLIPPLSWLIARIVTDKIRLRDVLASLIIFTGILMDFSRAAWGSLAFTIIFLIYLLYVTQKNRRSHKRIIYFVAAGTVAAVLIFMALSSIDVVHDTFVQRFHLFQSYDIDADNRSRYYLQRDSLREIFNHPLGMAPWGFAHYTGWVSHNVYLGVMLNHGWFGGIAFLTLILLTLVIGFQAMWVRTPWQPFLIATYVPFVALLLEALIADIDHWRHFYLMLGVIWALSAVTARFRYYQARFGANEAEAATAAQGL